MPLEPHLQTIYSRRFGSDQAYRNSLWDLLCREFFQKHIPQNAVVLEIAAGHCEFINNIKATVKIAVDANPETREHARPEVHVITTRSTDLREIASGSVDRVFTSNFLEHISREDILLTFKECHRVLADGGKILVLQPNIRYVYRDYWMFFDHITAIDDRSLSEALEIQGFKVDLLMPRFLPYTTKSALPKALTLVRLYLKLPLLWKFFGGQAFVVAKK